MDDDGRAGRLRSFALGGIVGAAGAIATRRQLAQARRLDRAPRGLAAFEDAPCFLELVGDEAKRHREAVEPAAGTSTRE
jgi:hypothetical protein